MNKQDLTAPINRVEGLLGEVNRQSKVCRSIPISPALASLERMQCFQDKVLPVVHELNTLNYSVEWDIDKQEYMLVELVEGADGWVHPTIRRR